MKVLTGQKAGTRNQMGKRKGAGKQCVCTISLRIIAIEKPKRCQIKWAELGLCWADQDAPNFMKTYHALSTAFLLQPAWRHQARTKMEQHRRLLLVLILSCLLQKGVLSLETAAGERRADKCWPGDLVWD